MTRSERRDIYRDLCAQGKITGLFMQPWWLDANGSWDVALGRRNDQIVGAMPYHKVRRRGIMMITMPVMTHHLSIWMDKPPDISERKWLTREKQIIWSIVDNLPRYGFFSMVFEEGSFNNWLPFHWKGFRQEMRYTFTIDREAVATLDQEINRNIRRNLKASAGEFIIKADVDAELFYTICRQTYQRQKIKMPYSAETFVGLDNAIQENQAGIKLGAYNAQGNPEAVAYLVWDQDRAYYFLAGDTDVGKNSGASILLCREAIRIALEEKKLSTFDFCGSMIESITDVRRQFGAKPAGLMKIYKARYKWLDILYSLTR